MKETLDTLYCVALHMCCWRHLTVAYLLLTAAAGFTLGALREVQKLQKMQVVDR